MEDLWHHCSQAADFGLHVDIPDHISVLSCRKTFCEGGVMMLSFWRPLTSQLFVSLTEALCWSLSALCFWVVPGQTAAALLHLHWDKHGDTEPVIDHHHHLYHHHHHCCEEDNGDPEADQCLTSAHIRSKTWSRWPDDAGRRVNTCENGIGI